MATPTIPTPREHIGDLEIGADGKPTGKITATRSWWRFWSGVGAASGTLSQPVTVAPNFLFSAGTINTGSTLTPMDIPTGTLLGNSAGADAPASPQEIGPSLELNGGTLALAKLGPGKLFGNGGTADTIPGPIIVGGGLALAGGILTVDTSAGIANVALVEAIAYWRP